MALDAERYPPFKTTELNSAYARVGYPKPPRDADEGAQYEHALGFFDQVIKESAVRGLDRPGNRLEAQSVVWGIERDLPEEKTGAVVEDADDAPDPERPPYDLQVLAKDLLFDIAWLRTIENLLDDKRQVIFQGPPGTGKTYVARKLAECLAGSAERVRLVQFHPSYAYEDFVHGIRPSLKAGQLCFELRDGPLIEAAEQARAESNAKHFLVIDEINRGNLAKVFGELYLHEHHLSGSWTLSVSERDALRDVLPHVAVEPVRGTEDAYCLTPGSIVGAVEIGELSVSIRPKLDIARVLFLACYAMGSLKLREMDRFTFQEATTLVEALAPALAVAARRAFAGGLLHGYRTEEEALHTVRGRIRIDDQLRRKFGVPVPVEVRYDEYTDDIMANRLVKAAVVRLGRMRLRSRRSRDGMRWVAGRLENVSLVEYPPADVPDVSFDRLNEHYREVVALARLILRHSSFETRRGAVRAPGFLIDMNRVFQEYVTRALREELGVSERVLQSDDRITRVYLDDACRVRLQPDLAWWDGVQYTFVADAKYKRTESESAPHADLYQLLAYVTALDLPGGLLIYAEGEQPPTHRVRHSGKLLGTHALDLSGTTDELLEGIAALARRVRALRAETWVNRAA